MDGNDNVALVLAGGGARGAYEAGVLSVLLPALEQRGQRPSILVGTSAGALNISFLAANAHLPADELMGNALAIWESVRWSEVARPLAGVASLRRAAAYAGTVLGVPGSKFDSLLDVDPLRATVRDQIDFRQIAKNVRAGRVSSAAVVATSAHTGRSVAFHAGGPEPVPDRRRRIDYVSTTLTEDHVLASAAIPTIFPAVHIRQPRSARGWYFDGGTRLNTPIKPALALGAKRVAVVAVDSLEGGPSQLATEQRPDALEGAGQVLLGLLDDQLRTDVLTLATINQLAGERQVPYIVVAPAEPGAIASLALSVAREHYGGLRASNVALLSRLVAGGTDAQHAALLSFLLFAPEFTSALVELGRQDADRLVGGGGDPWQI